VREAIRRLEAEGLVIYRPNAGAQVAPADPGLFDEEMTVLAVLQGYGLRSRRPAWARPRSLASRRSTTRWRWR
jgi:DNA-binding GntR family transcriptional regulator